MPCSPSPSSPGARAAGAGRAPGSSPILGGRPGSLSASPLQPPAHAAGTGIVFATILVLGAAASAAYSYFRLNRRRAGFQHFEVREERRSQLDWPLTRTGGLEGSAHPRPPEWGLGWGRSGPAAGPRVGVRVSRVRGLALGGGEQGWGGMLVSRVRVGGAGEQGYGGGRVQVSRVRVEGCC